MKNYWQLYFTNSALPFMISRRHLVIFALPVSSSCSYDISSKQFVVVNMQTDRISRKYNDLSLKQAVTARRLGQNHSKSCSSLGHSKSLPIKSGPRNSGGPPFRT
ncbi:hypothetical protein AMECASPLE_038019 [Ameca splendens]|uniref:Uncharacterized protein n=1 Tax=Ameca splendens TaxID=208324 RepID=A0ABV0YVT7_9TELE